MRRRVRSARRSATLLEEVSLGVGRRQGGCAFVGCGGLTVSTQPTKQIRSRGVERVVVVQVHLLHQRQRSRGASHLADGDGAVMEAWRGETGPVAPGEPNLSQRADV